MAAVGDSEGLPGSSILCVCLQASFLDSRVQCHAHHLLRISGASCKVPFVPLAHSPSWDGIHVTGRMGESWKEGRSGGPRTCPLSLGVRSLAHHDPALHPDSAM